MAPFLGPTQPGPPHRVRVLPRTSRAASHKREQTSTCRTPVTPLLEAVPPAHTGEMPSGHWRSPVGGGW